MIHLQVELVNQSNKPLRVIMPSAFLGERIRCENDQGQAVGFKGGYRTYSPKVNLYIGRPYLLQPNEKHVAKIDALLDYKYDFVCTHHSDSGSFTGYEDFKKNIGLPADYPAKYISDGRIFPLEKPGTYSLSYVYQVTPQDKTWRFADAKKEEEASIKHLWEGSATSNVIKLTVK